MITTLVTGGTGFVGSEIVRRLVAGRESVRVLSRDPASVDRRRRTPGTEFVRGDIFDDATLKAALSGCDALIIAAQFENAPFEEPRKGRTYMRVDGEGTERQVALAKEAGIRRIIYMSGAGTREGRTEPWFRAKARAEKAVKESGTNWTIFRPSWVYGPLDRSLNRFAAFARFLPVIPMIGTGREKIQPVFVRDVAEAVALSLNEPAAYGKMFEIGGPQTLEMREIVRTMLKVMGKKRLILPHPKPLMKLAARLLRFLPGPPLTPEAVDFITMEEPVDHRPLLETLNLRLTSLEDGLRTYLAPGPRGFSASI